MTRILMLAAAFLRKHPIRVILTSIATIASVSMVVWVAGSYDAILQTYNVYANKTFGTYPLSIAPISTTKDEFVPAEVEEALQADAAVAVIEAMWVRDAVVRPADLKEPSVTPEKNSRTNSRRRSKKHGIRFPLRSPKSTIIALNAEKAPFALLSGRWLDPANPAAQETVLSKNAAQRLRAKLGEKLIVGKGKQACYLKVVGIIDTPLVDTAGAPNKILTPGIGDLYVPMALAEKIHGCPFSISFLGVALKPDADMTKFRFGWAPRLSRFSVPVQFQEASDIEEALCETSEAENVQMQAYAAAGISLLVALLVIFCTLNMGASERVRQFAILRAIGLTRAEIGIMIAIEGLLLATIGFLGGIGIAFLLLMLTRDSANFQQSITIGPNSIFLAAIAAYGGGLFSSLIPAYRSVRIRPVEAMAAQPRSSAAGKLPVRAVIIGLLLISVNPLLTFVFPPDFESGIILTMVVGFSAMSLGFILIAPGVVALVDRIISPVLARLLGIEPKLLENILTSNQWRTVGAALSLSIGLGFFIAIQVWGFTMLDAFIPGNWVPDAIIAFGPDGLPKQKAAEVSTFPGVDSERCIPLVVEQPRLLEDITNSAERASVTRQDNVIIVGLDPEKAFGGNNPLLKVEWVGCSPEEAVSALKEGHKCIVPDHFLRETGLKIGDSFTVVPPENSDNPIQYTIAGAVRLPGWHWVSKFSGFRIRTHRAAAIVFSDYSSVAKDFDLHNTSHVWLAYGPEGADSKRLTATAQKLYSDFLQRKVSIKRPEANVPYVRVVPAKHLRQSLIVIARKWLWVICQVPLVALLVASLGVLNVIIASVRARRWSMGVLRSIGVTRWTLVRVVIAEGILIGIVSCILSLAFGIIAGWCGCGISQYISFFGGLYPALVIPWIPIISALLATLILSAFAAVWPAASISRLQPLSLLQQGRGAF